MKYAILGPRGGINRVVNTAPESDQIKFVEISDSAAETIELMLSEKRIPLFLDGEITSRADILEQGFTIRWNEDQKKFIKIPIVKPVPSQVPLWAFRQVLIEDGLLDSVLARVNDLSDATQRAVIENYLEYGNFIDRESDTLASLATSMNIAASQLDDIFRRASLKKL